MFLKMCMAECDRSPFWEGSKPKRQNLIKLVLCRSTGLEPSGFSCWLNSTFCWLNFHCMVETYRNPSLDGKHSQYHSDWQKWLTFANFQSLPALSIFTNLVFHLLVFTPNPQKSGPQAEGQGAQTQQGNSEMMFFSRGRMVKSKY